MFSVRILPILAVGVFSSVSAEPVSKPSPDATIFKSGKTSVIGSYWRQSRLDTFAADELKKTEELGAPVTVDVLSVGRSVAGLEEIRDRIIDVRIVNPNPYPVFFHGRQYKENKTIKPRWNKRKGGEWVLAAWDWCGTGNRDWEIEPGGSIDVMLYLHPELRQQQIVGRFYRVDKPSTQSDCLLYEKK